MLYLNPPYQVIDDVSILPDHADPLQFYFMPLSPHLTLVTDASTGQQIPQLQLIEYTGKVSPAPGAPPAEATGGFLNFDCNLGLSQDRIDAIGAEVRDRLSLSDTPTLSPVPLVGGSVRMMLLGAETPDPSGNKPKPPPSGGAPVAAVTAPKFVVQIDQAAKPSLYGDNQAAFSVQLDAAGATIMREALKGEMSPIGVVYELQFVGLRPAYHVHVHADWNRVQNHLETSFKTNLIVFSSEIDKVVDKLVEDKVIVIEGDLFVAEGDGSTGGESDRYKQAMTECREMITNTFFQPSLDPMASERGSALSSFERVTQTLAQGGFGSPFSYRSADLTRIDQKTINVDMSERTAVLRTIYPQGHLAGLARIIAEQHLDLADFTLRVSLEDDFFARRTMRVIPRVNFAAEGIESINVALTYEGDTKNVVFDAAAATEQSLDWASVLTGDDMRRPVSYRYTVGFAATATQGRPQQLISGDLPILDGDVVEVDPRRDGLYDVMPVPINVIDCPWDLFPSVELSCRYADPDHDIDVQDNYVLTAAQAAGAGSWPVFLADRERRTISYRVVYHGADGRMVDKGWVNSNEGQIRIADPFPRRRTLDVVVPSGLYDAGLDQAFVSLHYDDVANHVSKEARFTFTKDDSEGKTFSVELLDPAHREVSFKVQLLYADGRAVTVPTSTTVEDLLVVRADLKGHRSVSIRPQPGDFKNLGVKEVLVEARYEDATAHLTFADDIRLRAAGEQGHFEFDFVDEAKDTYRYRVTQAFENGLTKSSDWVDSDSAELLVPLS